MKKVFYIMILLAMVFTSCAPQPAAPTEAAPVETAAPVEPAATEAPVEPAEPAVKELTILWAEWDRNYLRKWAISMNKE
jgi:PBP1b-binding outer membrane lipoprotein LpoB